MTQHIGWLIALTAGYLGFLLLVTRLGDSTERGARLSRYPLVSALPLGAYLTAWSYYGFMGFAAHDGWLFLGGRLGMTLACALMPVVWVPLARLLHGRQLITLGDIFAFRYRSQSAGVVVTLVLLAACLPYQAVQLQAFVRPVEVLTGEGSGRAIALIISVLLIGLGMLFGARHVSPRDRHEGFVLAIATESIVMLIALLAVGAFALRGIFGGVSGLDAWLGSHPEVQERMNAPSRDGPWVSFLLMSAAASFMLPRRWNTVFTEGARDKMLRVGSWVLPTYLLIGSLALPPILWAGQKLALDGDPDIYVLLLATQSGSPWLTSLVYLGGLSAISAMILVTTLALAGLCQNYLLLPLLGLSPGPNFYRRLLWMRRGIIAVLVLVGHALFEILPIQGSLTDLAFVSFLALSQFLPGLVGVLFWPRATLRGFLAGLIVGIVLWITTVLVPLFVSGNLDFYRTLGVHGDPWSLCAALSLGLNTIVFLSVSSRDAQRATEAEAAAICRNEAWTPPPEAIAAASADEFACRLATVLGADVAEQEVTRALHDLGLHRDERRPAELWRLRDRIEQNLSGLVGPVLAKMTVDETLSRDPNLRIMAGDVRNSRRYLRRILEDLPLGVCTLGPGGEVVLWNATLTEVTGIRSEDAVGHSLPHLCEPWGSLLSGFAAGNVDRDEHTVHPANGARVEQRQVALGKAAVDPDALPDAMGSASAGLVLLVEDRTKQHEMATSLALRDRLASVGRLATGCAHRLRKPVAGISIAAHSLQRHASDIDTRDRLRRIAESCGYVLDIIQTLGSFSASGDDHRPMAVAEIVHEALILAQRARPDHRTVWRHEICENLWIHGDPQALTEVLVNLLTNAADASPEAAEVLLRATRDMDHVRIEVIDSGTGMSQDVQGRMYEPFYTTKKEGDGMGLGLWLVHNIVREHEGRMNVESAEGKGTRMSIFLRPFRRQNEPDSRC